MSLSADALRVGMITVRPEEGVADETPFRQLALYEDESTAQGVAQELADEYARAGEGSGCETSPLGFGGPWTSEPVAGPHDVLLAWSGRPEGSEFTQAVAIVHRGRAVLLVFEVAYVEPGPRSQAVMAARKAVADNVDLICEIADCD